MSKCERGNWFPPYDLCPFLIDGDETFTICPRGCFEPPPGVCPVAPILKLLAEAKEIYPPSIGPAYQRDMQKVTFWIRR